MTLWATSKKGWSIKWGGGATQAQQGMTIQITNIYFLFVLPWEPDPPQNVRTGPVLKLAARWEPGRFSPPASTFNSVVLTIDIFGSHWPVLSENRNENRLRFSASGWEPPNTALNPLILIVSRPVPYLMSCNCVKTSARFNLLLFSVFARCLAISEWSRWTCLFEDTQIWLPSGVAIKFWLDFWEIQHKVRKFEKIEYKLIYAKAGHVLW
jgi:hypothetical protein